MLSSIRITRQAWVMPGTVQGESVQHAPGAVMHPFAPYLLGVHAAAGSKMLWTVRLCRGPTGTVRAARSTRLFVYTGRSMSAQ